MLKRIDKNANSPDFKRQLEDVYAPIATEIHAASYVHWKWRLDETLQEYIQNFIDLTEKAMGIDTGNITNCVTIFYLS